MASPAKNCQNVSTGFLPLTDLGTGRYLGQFEGGLYPNGSNGLPEAHLRAGLAAGSEIIPRDTAGNPDVENGKTVLVSIGMSNTTVEFCNPNQNAPSGCSPDSFVGQAAASAAVNHRWLTIVDGAQSSATAVVWAHPTHPRYDLVDARLAAQGLTPLQVGAVWVKVADAGPKVSLPNSDADAYTLLGHMAAIARALKQRYPNVKQVFYSSRIYAGYADVLLNPEPYAYESGFSVKWLVEAQIDQMANGGTPVNPLTGDLNYTSVVPWIAWGAYLWADGLRPRSDGLTYTCDDFGPDGTHPAHGAIEKVGTLLLDFFLNSPVTQSWFPATPSTPTPSATRVTSPAATPTNTRTTFPRTPTAMPTATASSLPAVDLNKAVGRPGGSACLPVTLTSHAAQVTITTNAIGFEPSLFSVGGCTINPAIGPGTAASKQLLASAAQPGLEWVGIGANMNSIPDGLLYTCTLRVAVGATPGSHSLSNTVTASDTTGHTIPGATGAPGEVVVTSCTGDCNGDGTVSIGEVIKCGNLFLGEPLCNATSPDLSCPAADADLDGIISIGEVTQCVDSFLNGC